MLIDTDVLIWHMKGNEKARKLINSLPHFYISSITYMELLQGLRNKQELSALKQFIQQKNIDIYHVNQTISNKAVFLLEMHFHSHGIRLADTLIAATALTLGIPLTSGNIKHYQIIKELDLKTFKV